MLEVEVKEVEDYEVEVKVKAADKSKTYKCPFCDFRAKSFSGLKLHVIKVHRKYFRYCPVCGEHCKNIVTHARNHAWMCEEHRILYALIACRIKKKKMKEWVEWAIERLEVSYT